MDKIYSRKRIRMPNMSFSRFPNEKKDRNRKRMIEISLILTIAIIAMVMMIKAITPIIDRLCADESKRKATMISNVKATEVMANYTYDDMVTIYRDSEDNITMLKSNIIVINEITSDVAVKIQEEFQKDNESKMNVKLRKPYRYNLFCRNGP